MSTTNPGGTGGEGGGNGGHTQVPTMFLGGGPVERRELFHGRSVHWTELPRYAAGMVLAAFGVIGGIAAMIFALLPLAILGGLLGMAGFALVGWAWLSVVSVSYRVDTLRVEVERGILRKRIDNLELWRVKDLRFQQGLVQRMLGVGDVVLVTSDATTPVVTIQGVHGARALYDALRDAVDQVRRGRGVMGVESTG